MKVRFMGAARTVTGSCYILNAGSHRFALDCGMHQGGTEIEQRNWDTSIYRPADIEFFIITHAHIDHTGLLPRMTKNDFKGRIYATPPTADLMRIMLLDSAHVQEMEAQWRNKKSQRHGGKQVAPLYTQRDAEAVFPLFEPVPYEKPFAPFPGLEINFRDAGHILGASMVEMWTEEGGARMKLVFSGDIGRPAQLIIEDPSIVKDADFLFLESTYGNRDHKDEDASLDELADAVAYSYGNRDKVIIPAFAVERTQEMIYSLYLLQKDGRLPKDMPVFVDSPLAIQATEIFRRWTQYMDQDTRRLLANREDPFAMPNLHYSLTTEESIAINNLKGPAVVISASGMADAGRIKHHLRHNLWREGASVVFVGFQADGTTGRKIIDGAQKVRIFNEDVAVKAKIYTINGFSAHAGQSQILQWLSHFEKNTMQVILVHGEYAAQQVLADRIKERFGMKTLIPDYLEEIALKPGVEPARVAYSEKAPAGIDWDHLLDDLEHTVARLRLQKTDLDAKGAAQQDEIRNRLLEAGRRLSDILPD